MIMLTDWCGNDLQNAEHYVLIINTKVTNWLSI